MHISSQNGTKSFLCQLSLRRFSSHILFRSQAGLLLTDALVSLAILGVVIAGVATVMGWQASMTQQAADKIAKMDLSRQVTQLLAVSDQCTRNFSGITAGLGTSSAELTLPRLNYYNVDGSPVPETSLSAGGKVSPDSSLTIQSISLTGVQSLSSSTTRADLRIGLNSSVSSGRMALAPLIFPGILFRVDSSGRITECAGASVPFTAQNCPANTVVTGIDGAGNVICNPAPTTVASSPPAARGGNSSASGTAVGSGGGSCTSTNGSCSGGGGGSARVSTSASSGAP